MANRLELLPRPRELRLDAIPELRVRVRAARPIEAERAKARLQASLGQHAGLAALALPAEGFTLEITARGEDRTNKRDSAPGVPVRAVL